MTVAFESGYALPAIDQPLTHARILHARNWLDGGTASASSTDPGYFEAAPTNPLTYERWKPNTTGAETWEYDHGSSVEADCACIGGHTLGTSNVQLEIQYWNGSIWVDLVLAFVPPDDSPIMAIFAPVSAQRWRIRVTPQSGTAAYVAVFKVGKALQMERPINGNHRPEVYGRNSRSDTNRSETGETLGRSVQSTTLEASFSWNILTDSWVDANWPDLQLAVEREPFFVAWRPLDRPECALCDATDTPQVNYTGESDFMSGSLRAEAVAWS